MEKDFQHNIEEVDAGVTPVPQNELRSVFGSFEVVSAVPTAVPITLGQQIKVYVSGGTSRLYIYDASTATWKYTALT